jgi:hypothetical protein
MVSRRPCDDRAMNDWSPLAKALNRTMTEHAPGWTDRNDSDPGLTILELMAFLSEQTLFEREPVPGGAAAAARVIAALAVHSSVVRQEWFHVKRPRYFDGRLLTADDLREEQEYHISSHRRHLQLLHASGVVRGLQVSASGGAITIQPGLAIDPLGREIYLATETTVTPAANATSPTLISVEYVERLVDPVIALEGTEASRIEEGCGVVMSESPCERCVALARIVRDHDGWRVDPTPLK